MSSITQPLQRKRDFRALLLLFIKGLAMGAADAVPGVSGGTIAFITNIYEELLDSLKRCNPLALKTLFYGEGSIVERMRALWHQVNATFLVTLLAGIATSLLVLANLVLYLLQAWREPTMGFFSGLVLASAVCLGYQKSRWNWRQLLLVIAGLLLTLMLAFLPRAGGEVDSLVYFFFCGALAICAMILPGISGAFILLLLGAYEAVLSAVMNFQLDVIAVFIVGCVIGLLSFANLLSWLFQHHRQATLAFLLGVLLGSLYSIWPWQVAAAWANNSGGEMEAVMFRAVSPIEYERVVDAASHVVMTIAAALFGFMLVLSLEYSFARGRRHGGAL